MREKLIEIISNAPITNIDLYDYENDCFNDMREENISKLVDYLIANNICIKESKGENNGKRKSN